MKKLAILATIGLFGILSCSDKDDEEPHASDPLIGTWHLVALDQGDQTIDVKEEACLRDSQMNVILGTMTLTLSAPLKQGSSECQTESSSIGWANEEGTYYTVEDGQKKTAIFMLDPDNRLEVDITLGDSPITLIFEK